MTFDWDAIAKRATMDRLDVELSWESLTELKQAGAEPFDELRRYFGFVVSTVGDPLVTARRAIPSNEVRLVDRRTGAVIATIQATP